MSHFDYVLVGGGLQSGLIALALRARRPECRIALVERASRLGGNHTWCFHAGDVPPGSAEWLEPLVAHRWPGYRVLFPSLDRTILDPYAAVTSRRLDEVVASAIERHPGSRLMLDTEAAAVAGDRVTTASGEEVLGTVVVDARGPGRATAGAPCGYQKFLGLEIDLQADHGLDMPILMDATVDQTHGYRFFYLLPMGPRRLLVEDTYFHDSPALDREALRAEVRAYVARRGWRIAEVVREEIGVLPMPWAGTFERPGGGPLRAGYRGGWFHPGTGYSFPVALRLAEQVAALPPDGLFGIELRRLADRHARQAAFARFLNRLLFRWYPPAARRPIFERFYRLPTSTIGNLYALRLRWRDGIRLLFGRPPPGLSLRHRLRPSKSDDLARDSVAPHS